MTVFVTHCCSLTFSISTFFSPDDNIQCFRVKLTLASEAPSRMVYRYAVHPKSHQTPPKVSPSPPPFSLQTWQQLYSCYDFVSTSTEFTTAVPDAKYGNWPRKSRQSLITSRVTLKYALAYKSSGRQNMFLVRSDSASTTRGMGAPHRDRVTRSQAMQVWYLCCH